jgi:hypothetical protein
MYKSILLAGIICLSAVVSKAQLYQGNVRQGEFGLAVGAGHYFGDLNTRASLNRPKFSAGAFYIKQFNNYIGLKIAANYARLGYSDIYSKNKTQRRRNLSFNSNIWEFSASGQFNFFHFNPGVDGYNFTPYVSLGVGIFSYDPYAYLAGNKYYLRPLGTEGQGSSLYPNRKQYGTIAGCFPLSVGLKYALTEGTNVFAEVGYRFTTTDYLDDVSTTFVGEEPFVYPSSDPTVPPSVVGPDGQVNPAYLLSDRSYETGTRIGIKDRQRGNSQQKDAYVLAQIGVSFNITSYKCPTAAGKDVKF